MDEYFMKIALDEALKAFEEDEVPIGAVVVREREIIAKAHNLRESLNDPTAHAEIIAIREAAEKLSSWRLIDCNLYVTIEPCPMCAGAIVQSRIKRLIYGAKDPKAGAVDSVMNIVDNPNLNHSVEVTSGILQYECSNIMKEYFRGKRK
jgi:tRNA(adenine34) deaminase